MDRERDDDGNSSQRSGNTASETSSQRSDLKFLNRKRRSSDDADEGDLLQQKRTIQDGIFACMSTLVRQSALSSWQLAAVRVALEFLMFFLVLFNPSYPQWRINSSNPMWQIIRWALWRDPVVQLYGYRMYIIVLYVQAGIVYVAVGVLTWLTLALRRSEQSRALRLAAQYLHVVYEIVFSICYASIFDYFIYVADCNFDSDEPYHVIFTDVACFKMPHLLHTCIALLTAAIFLAVTALFVVASCDLNPISTAYLASPVVYPRLKILAAKAVLIVVAADLDFRDRVQAVVIVIAVSFICWWHVKSLLFYRSFMNIVWCGLWAGLLYIAFTLVVTVLGPSKSEAYLQDRTKTILWGIFPAIAAGMFAVAVRVWWDVRPARLFQPPTAQERTEGTGGGGGSAGDSVGTPRCGRKPPRHVFSDASEVERLARVMRVLDSDGHVDESAAAWGERVLTAGLHAFPGSPYLLVLAANFQLQVRRDGPSARTQLQMAARHNPSLVERYQIFCTHEASKRLKDSQEGGLDLQAYMEFKRNLRAVLRAHKAALALQVELWALFLRPRVRVTQVDAALGELEAAASRAATVYRKVIERYPTNGKLLRCYGKFLEDIQHDTVTAARAYAEASRYGGRDALLSLDLGGMGDGEGGGTGGRPEFLSSISVEEDAIVVINAEGTILMASQAIQGMFGYPRAQLEGANVALLMPQPYCQRHPTYLQRITVGGGEPRLLDSARDFVALHRDHYVFPITIAVTKLSGTGTDSIFLGLLRSKPPSAYYMRAWVTPQGQVLCTDAEFSSLVGVGDGELVGRPFASLVPSGSRTVLEALLEQCRADPTGSDPATYQARPLTLVHRYLDPIPVEMTAAMAGTETQRILLLQFRRTDGRSSTLMVVDLASLRIRFASSELAAMLGYTPRQLVGMKLDALLPPPFDALHAKWLREPPHAAPAASCRCGLVVQLLGAGGRHVPVRLRIVTGGKTDAMYTPTYYIVHVEKVTSDEEPEEKRLILTADFSGTITSVSWRAAGLFGFPASDLLGAHLCDCVDVFGEWRARSGGAVGVQLLLLALLDKEQETPGSSWRVHVRDPRSLTSRSLSRTTSRPTTAASAGHAGAEGAPGAGAGTWHPACMQVDFWNSDEHEEEEDGGATDGSDSTSRVRVVLWLRDLLSGVLELDEGLIVRRVGGLTGLILGVPHTALLKKPLGRFLDIPKHPGLSWQQLVNAATAHVHHRHRRKSALKSSLGRGAVSPLLLLSGPHPDGAPLRLRLQGVQTLAAPGGRPKFTVLLHPDPYADRSHADLLRVLRLEAAVEAAASAAASAAVTPAPAVAFGGVPGLGVSTVSLAAGMGEGSGEAAEAATTAASGGVVQAAAKHAGGKTRERREGRGEHEEEDSEDAADRRSGESSGGDADHGGGSDSSGSDSGGSDSSAYSEGGIRHDGCEDRKGDVNEEEDEEEAEGHFGGMRNISPEAATAEVAELFRTSATKAEFVAAWVRLTSRTGSFLRRASLQRRGSLQRTGTLQREGTLQRPGSLHREGTSGLQRQGTTVGTVAGAAVEAGATEAEAMQGTAPADSSAAIANPPPLERHGMSGLRSAQRTSGTSACNVSGMEAATEVEEEDGKAGGDGGDGDSGRMGQGREQGQGPELGGGGRQTNQPAPHRPSAAGLSVAAAGSSRGGGGGGGGVGGGGGGGTGFTTTPTFARWPLRWIVSRSSSGWGGFRSGRTSQAGKSEESSGKDAKESGGGGGGGGGAGEGGQEALPPLEDGNGGEGGERLGGGGVPKWERAASESGESSTDGDRDQLSGAPDTASSLDLGLDTRRVRLLKGLQKILLGPALTIPLDRMRIHSYMLIGVMLLTHVVAYVVVTRLIDEQHTNVYEVHRQALALDRSQLVMWRVMMGPFCERANNTAKVSVCANTMSYTISKLIENIDLMESYHQSLYLGITGMTQLQEPNYGLWTQQQLEYNIFLDTQPPRVITAHCGVWQLGNAFLAAAREALYWMPKLGDLYKFHRTWKFMVDAGLDPLYKGYMLSLERFTSSAWDGVLELRKELIIMLVVEACFIQIICSAYQWVLVKRLETARLMGVCAIMGLPGGALRQLASRDIKVLDDDDDESDTSEISAEEAERHKASGGGSGSGTGGGTGRKGSGGDPERVGPPGVRKLERGGSGGGGIGREGRAGRELSFEQVPLRGLVHGGGALESGAGGYEGEGPYGKSDGAGSVRRIEASAGSMARFRLRTNASMVVNGRRLLPSYINQAKFMAPFLLWNAAVVTVYAVSLAQLSGMHQPLASLNMAAHVVFRYTRMRVMAFGLVSQDDSESRAMWRDWLKRELRLFEDEYNILMYGGMALSQRDSHFQEQVPAGTFQSASFATQFFRDKRCFRWNQTLCLPRGHPYYEVTHNGLDVMVRRVIQEVTLLSLDADADVVYNKSRYDFIHAVGGRDCYEGLQTATQLFVDYSIGRYNDVTRIHAVLLAITIVMILIYVVMLLWPHLARVRGDAVRQSALLSHVPPEVDVKAHVRTLFRRLEGGRKRTSHRGVAGGVGV